MFWCFNNNCGSNNCGLIIIPIVEVKRYQLPILYVWAIRMVSKIINYLHRRRYRWVYLHLPFFCLYLPTLALLRVVKFSAFLTPYVSRNPNNVLKHLSVALIDLFLPSFTRTWWNFCDCILLSIRSYLCRVCKSIY